MYIIHEYQTNASGVTVIVPPVAKATEAEAYNAFYTICAAASISSVPCHTAMLCYHNGNVLESKVFERLQESEPENEVIENG